VIRPDGRATVTTWIDLVAIPSDMSDAEWAYIEPMLPPVPKDGRPEKHDRRDIVDAILYVTHNGIVWRALPADFPEVKGGAPLVVGLLVILNARRLADPSFRVTPFTSN
jgi:hypothetical protein